MLSKLSATMASYKQKHFQLESTRKARLEPREVRRDNYYYISTLNTSSVGGTGVEKFSATQNISKEETLLMTQPDEAAEVINEAPKLVLDDKETIDIIHETPEIVPDDKFDNVTN